MKKFFIILIAFILISIIIYAGSALLNNKNVNDLNDQDKYLQILEYENSLKEMDLLPNTIVAKLNGEPILFREIGTKLKQIEYSNENKSDSSIKDENAFYDVLVDKLYIEYAKKYPDEVSYNLNIEETIEKTKRELTQGYDGKTPEECKEEMLELMCIDKGKEWFNDKEFISYVQSMMVDQMLEAKGNSIISKFMIEKPEFVDDEEYNKKLDEYIKIKEKRKQETVNSNNANILIESMSNSYELLSEIREIYIKKLILSSKLELCADKNELYERIPEIYHENKSKNLEIEVEDENIDTTKSDNKNDKEVTNVTTNSNETTTKNNNTSDVDFQKSYEESISKLDNNYFLKDIENYEPEGNGIRISEARAKEIAEIGFQESANRIAGEGVENKESETVKLEEKSPNNYFTRHYYEGDKINTSINRTCYVITRENEMGCGVSIYVDATTGLIIGGDAYGD